MTRKAFFEMTPADEEFVWRHIDKDDALTTPELFDPDRLPDAKQCEIVSVFINSRLNESALSALPALKLIATRSTGYDHIDLEYCRKHGITVSNVPVYGDNTVAEHTFALILALLRKVIQSHNRARAGDFSPAGLQGFDLRGKTLSVVGTGHIGVHVIRIARGFMMKVIAIDSRPDKRLADALDFDYVDSLCVFGSICRTSRRHIQWMFHRRANWNIHWRSSITDNGSFLLSWRRLFMRMEDPFGWRIGLEFLVTGFTRLHKLVAGFRKRVAVLVAHCFERGYAGVRQIF